MQPLKPCFERIICGVEIFHLFNIKIMEHKIGFQDESEQ